MNQYERTFYENRLASANRLYNEVFRWFRSQVARNNKLQDEVESLTARNEELQENVDLLLDNLDIAVNNGINALAERDKEIDNLKRRITDLEFGAGNKDFAFDCVVHGYENFLTKNKVEMAEENQRLRAEIVRLHEEREKPNEPRFAPDTVVRSKVGNYYNDYVILNDEDALVFKFYVNDDGYPVYSKPFVMKNFVHPLERMVDEARAEVTFDPRSNRVYYTPGRKP